MNRKAGIWMAAVLLAGLLTGCGNESSKAQQSAGSADSSTASSISGEENSTAENSDNGGESSSADSTASSASDVSSESSSESGNGESSTANEDSASSGESGESGNSGNTGNTGNTGNSGNTGNTGNTGNNGSSGNTGNNGNTGNSGNTGNTGNTGNSGNTQQAGASEGNDSDLDQVDEEKPTKYIYLNGTTAKFQGEGISISGNKIFITKGGDYEISGTLENGQIYIETEKKKVRLHLNNCTIKNKAGSAIFCQQAKKVTIYSMPGTVNYISDGGTHDDDNGAIFSEDTVVFKGEGEINITGVYAHGVQSDDDILVKGGKLNITATKSCLHSNDSIEIYDGTLYCDGGTNGIKTDGYVLIAGGNSTFIGGVREEKGSIYCDGAFTVTGGSFIAIGNSCATPDAATTTANLIGVVFSSSQPANTAVKVTSGANQIFSITSKNNFRSVYYAGANLLKNATYQVNYGGKDGGSFTAGNTVTVYTVS